MNVSAANGIFSKIYISLFIVYLGSSASVYDVYCYILLSRITQINSTGLTDLTSHNVRKKKYKTHQHYIHITNCKSNSSLGP